MTFAAEVERVWPGRSARFEVLGGGITNHNLRVDVDGEHFVLRVAGKDTNLLGIDRTVELAATEAAAALGIGPEVVFFVEPEGWLVTRFVEGEIPSLERMREPEMLRRVAAALRTYHDGPVIPGTFDSFRVVETYRRTAEERGGQTPDAYEWAHEIAGRIERRRAADVAVPCHNDLLNANFLDDGERLRIVDWEYAGMGDRFFDLANFSVNHELDATQSEMLLEAYVGDVRPADVEALELMRFMSDFREAMWGVVQSAVSELDFDFDSYAAEHFERLERTAASPAFRRGVVLNARGAPCGRPSCSESCSRLCLGREREPSLLLLLQALELLLGAHPHRALEPLVRGEDPPSAEEQQRSADEDRRVVHGLPGEPVLPRCADRVRRHQEHDADEERPRRSRSGRSTCSDCRVTTRPARTSPSSDSAGSRAG